MTGKEFCLPQIVSGRELDPISPIYNCGPYLWTQRQFCKRSFIKISSSILGYIRTVVIDLPRNYMKFDIDMTVIDDGQLLFLT